MRSSRRNSTKIVRRKRRYVSNNFIQNYADNINLRAAKNFFENEIEWGVSRGTSLSICNNNIRQDCEIIPDLLNPQSPKDWVS